MSNPNDLFTSCGRFRWFTFGEAGVWDASTDLDLEAVGGSSCRRLTLMSDGVIIVLPTNPINAGQAETSPELQEGTELEVQARKVLKESTITGLFVEW